MSQEGFSRLLRGLDGEVDSQGQRYNDVHQRVINYFNRKKCHMSEVLAVETFRRVEEFLKGEAKNYKGELIKLCYTTARFVFLEYLRSPERSQEQLDLTKHEPFTDPAQVTLLEEEREKQEKRLACLETCSQTLLQAQKLSTDDLNLVIRYYNGAGRALIDHRKALAAERGKSPEALRKNACDIRKKLRNCVMECMGEKPS